jgi:hypothetical protein
MAVIRVEKTASRLTAIFMPVVGCLLTYDGKDTKEILNSH